MKKNTEKIKDILKENCCMEQTDKNDHDCPSKEAREQIEPDQEPMELMELEEQFLKAQQERDEYLAMAQRLQAEFDNFRKRNRSAIADAYKDASTETVEQFLPVLDNLQRALESMESDESPQVSSLYKGVEMVAKQFISALEKLGVEEIKALGEAFDPTYHEAVMTVEAEDEEQRNTIVEVLLKGYKREDKVIRYSMVKVAN